jgi:hypothetical protein
MKNASPVGGKAHLEAVRTLRQLLSNYENPPTLAVLSFEGIPALVSALQPTQSNETAVETIFEAAWALTNLAVGEPEVVKAVVPAAPLLIAHLGGGSGLAVTEQCAWALGNIAGDDVEYREILISNGAVPPLAQLMVYGVQAAVNGAAAVENVNKESQQIIQTGATASWALENLLRGAGEAEISDFMNTEGALFALDAALSIYVGGDETPLPALIENLCVEAAWVLAYVTSGPEKYLLKSFDDRLPLISTLNSKINAAVEALFQISEAPKVSETFACGLVTPLLRALGNILAGVVVKKDFPTTSLLPSNETTIKAVVICAESAHDHGLQREAAWVLANYAGLPGRHGVDAIKKAGAVPALMALLKNQPFHVRKEAAFALANICAGGGGGTGDAEALNYLFGADLDALRAMLSLVRSADVEAARLGLQFVEMLLRMLPVNGAREVEAADGIDALEQLQFGAIGGEEEKAAAAALVNTYWGVGEG